MRHRKHKITLDRTTAGRRALLSNLAASVILYERVTTTHARAKAVVPVVERLLAVGKTNSLSHRRRLIAALPIKSAAAKIVDILAPRYQHRSSGYLRIVRLRDRQGDGAAMALVEFV